MTNTTNQWLIILENGGILLENTRKQAKRALRSIPYRSIVILFPPFHKEGFKVECGYDNTLKIVNN